MFISKISWNEENQEWSIEFSGEDLENPISFSNVEEHKSILDYIFKLLPKILKNRYYVIDKSKKINFVEIEGSMLNYEYNYINEKDFTDDEKKVMELIHNFNALIDN